MEALSCVIQDFFGSIPALLCDTPYCSRLHSLLHRQLRWLRVKPGELIRQCVQPFFPLRFGEIVPSCGFCQLVLIRPLFPDGLFSTADPLLNFCQLSFPFSLRPRNWDRWPPFRPLP